MKQRGAGAGAPAYRRRTSSTTLEQRGAGAGAPAHRRPTSSSPGAGGELLAGHEPSRPAPTRRRARGRPARAPGAGAARAPACWRAAPAAAPPPHSGHWYARNLHFLCALRKNSTRVIVYCVYLINLRAPPSMVGARSSLKYYNLCAAGAAISKAWTCPERGATAARRGPCRTTHTTRIAGAYHRHSRHIPPAYHPHTTHIPPAYHPHTTRIPPA